MSHHVAKGVKRSKASMLALLITGSIFLVPSQADALSCGVFPFTESFAKHDLLLHGVLVEKNSTSTRGLGQMITALTFDTIKVYKGEHRDSFTIRADLSHDDFYRIGVDYVLFADKDGDDYLRDLCVPDYVASKQIIGFLDSYLSNPSVGIGVNRLYDVVGSTEIYELDMKMQNYIDLNRGDEILERIRQEGLQNNYSCDFAKTMKNSSEYLSHNGMVNYFIEENPEYEIVRGPVNLQTNPQTGQINYVSKDQILQVSVMNAEIIENCFFVYNLKVIDKNTNEVERNLDSQEVICLAESSKTIFPDLCKPKTGFSNEDGYSLARIQWPDRCYTATNFGTVRIIEPDNNFDPTKPDSFEIQAWSSHDKNHILNMTVTETGKNTNAFEGTIPFGEIGDESSPNRLHISNGITIMAKYVDRTLPPNILYSEVPVTLGTEIKITPYDFPPSQDHYDGKEISYDPCIMQVLEIAKDRDLSWLNLTFPNPSQQLQSGLSLHEIKCKHGLTLTFKANDDSPVCVKPNTISKLFEREWLTHDSKLGLYPTSKPLQDGKEYSSEPKDVITWLFAKELKYKGISFQNLYPEYINTDEGYLDTTRVCSPLVSPNGTEFYISAVFHSEPFEITGIFIDKTEPNNCHKYWSLSYGTYLVPSNLD